MNEKIIMTAEQYDRIDGKNAYASDIKRITLGAPMLEENKRMKIAAQIWHQSADGTQAVATELPIHQVLDLAILVSRTLLYFRDAYRMPLMYNPQSPMVERIGMQGDAMSVAVCTENPNIDEEIVQFSDAINSLGELTGERLNILSRILRGLEY